MTTYSEIKFSAKESLRFGYKIWRGEIDVLDVDYIERLIVNEKPDIVILRLPVEQKLSINKLYSLGWKILHCDTLLYYECELTQKEILPLKNDLVFHVVNESSQYIVDNLIDETFHEYKNHYFANPAFSKTQITEGYKEWAKSFIDSNNSNRFSWYITFEGEAVAFMVCEIVDKNRCQPFLSGVKKAHRNKGVYSDIFKFIKKYFNDRGVITMQAITQVQNYVSNQILIKEGFCLKRSFDTYHINCFNSAVNDISK